MSENHIRAEAASGPIPAEVAISTDRRISLRVSDGLYRELTLRKLDEGRPLNSIIIDAIRAYLKAG